MSDCVHPDFRADVSVGRITDGEDGPVTQFVADVTVQCKACGEFFGFRGPPAGHSWNEPRCQIDAKKISLPLMSPAELELAGPLPAMSRGPMVYEVYPRETQSHGGRRRMSGKLDQLARAAELERKAEDAVYRGALEAVAAGFSEVAVAAAIGRVPATVTRWVQRATEHPDCRGFGCEGCDDGHLPLADVLSQSGDQQETKHNG